MGRVGKKAQSQVLPTQRGGKAQIADRDRKMEPDGGRYCGHLEHNAGGSMMLWSRLRSWMRVTLLPSRMESEMDTELRFHLEAYAEDLIRSGVPRQEAMRRARLEFGGFERAKEECREARGVNAIESLIQDLRFGLRMLRKSPTLTLTVVLTLAIGIGGNTAMFTVIRAVLLKPLEYRDPDKLVRLSLEDPQQSKRDGSFTLKRLEEMRAS